MELGGSLTLTQGMEELAAVYIHAERTNPIVAGW